MCNSRDQNLCCIVSGKHIEYILYHISYIKSPQRMPKHNLGEPSLEQKFGQH